MTAQRGVAVGGWGGGESLTGHRYWAELRRYLKTKLLAMCPAIFELYTSGGGWKYCQNYECLDFFKLYCYSEHKTIALGMADS